MDSKDFQAFIRFYTHVSPEVLREFITDIINEDDSLLQRLIEFYKENYENYSPMVDTPIKPEEPETIGKIFDHPKLNFEENLSTYWWVVIQKSRKLLSELETELGKIPGDKALSDIMQWITGFIFNYDRRSEKRYPPEEMRQVCCPFLDIMSIYVEQDDVSEEVLEYLCGWLFDTLHKEGSWRKVFFNDLVNMAIKVVSLKRVPRSLRAQLLEKNQDIDAVKCHFVKTNFLVLIDNNETEKAHEYISEHLTDHGVLGFYLEFLKSTKSYLFLMQLITHALLGAFPTRELKECVDMVYELYLQGKRDMKNINLPLPGFLNPDNIKSLAEGGKGGESEPKDEESSSESFDDTNAFDNTLHTNNNEESSSIIGDENLVGDTSFSQEGDGYVYEDEQDNEDNLGDNDDADLPSLSIEISYSTDFDNIKNAPQEANTDDDLSSEEGESETVEGSHEDAESVSGFDLDLSDLDDIALEEFKNKIEEGLKSLIKRNEVNEGPVEFKPEDMSNMNVYLMIPDDSMAENYRLYFVRTHGDMTYYRRMKKLVPSDRWPDFLKKILEETEFLPSMYLDDEKLANATDSSILLPAKAPDNNNLPKKAESKKYSYDLPPRLRSHIIDVYIEESDFESLAKYIRSGEIEDYYDSILDLPVELRKDLLEEYYFKILNLMSGATTKDQFLRVLPHMAQLIKADPDDEYIHDFIELEKSIFFGDRQIHTEWMLFLLRSGYTINGDRVKDSDPDNGQNK